MRFVNRARRALVCAGIVSILASCSSSASVASMSTEPATSPSATPAQSRTAAPTVRPTAFPSQPESGRIEVKDAGYAITLADNWFRVDLGSGALENMVKAGSSQLTPAMEQYMTSQAGALVAAGISMFAYRVADDSAGPGTTANVLTMSTFGMSLDTLETLNLAQLRSLLGKDLQVASTRVDLPIGQSVRFAYRMPVRDAGISIGAIQYLVVVDTKQFILSCTTPSDAAGIADECESMARSFEVLR